MNEFQRAKEIYETAPVPRELDARVRKGIAEGKRRAGRRRAARRCTGSMVACLAVLAVSLNVFPTFAAAAAEVPVMGGFFQVLTVRSWERVGDGYVLHVDQPAVSQQTSGSGVCVEVPRLSEQINQEIQKRVDDRIAEGQQMIAEYREAFLSTGGTEAEWSERENRVDVTYNIESQTENTVSFVVHTSVLTAVGNQQNYYYNLDLNSGKELTLQDLLGDDWVRVCNDSIRDQIASSKNPGVFFDDTMGGFETVDETTGFYINGAGNPVVVFPRATIAVGAMGAVEFEITG